METTTALDARAWIDGFIAVIAARSAELTELDRQAGDGDYGTNLRSALRRTETNLNGVADDSPEAVFTAVSDAFLNTGGTSGPLFGMWFREFAKAADGEPTTATLAEGAANAVAAVQRLGKAEVGHKTMVDAMAPAAEALAAAAARGADLPEALRETAAAAHAGARSTEELLAQRGRASYVGEHARGSSIRARSPSPCSSTPRSPPSSRSDHGRRRRRA
ncbi:DAK2 domain-containing protein [Nocardiopsis composta]